MSGYLYTAAYTTLTEQQRFAVRSGVCTDQH